ncbi:RNA polymerase sigma-70 factor [Rhodocytophaga rosea]|uniref:RNA polymerase sigma-70 factor n=1 Tax=Rhodocytophaga rosea TaxID=2704465 RepID=A0A6C0GIY0_9BACT|nr:RNA polymerase sigma-70 factor [Rhodocytophaga rosea]QHT67643.1 RNA polymerase sigma-70 factor [Rhodocytophaga rosea]
MNTTYTSARSTDADTIELLISGDEAVFEKVFKSYFKALHAYAFTILKEDEIAEEMVQVVFMKIWEKKEGLSIQTSLKAYLYRSVYNESINYLKHQKVKLKYKTHAAHQMKHETDNASNQVQHQELEDRLHKALNELPEGCRTIFQLSRFEELKYQEIADKLQISIKTVENQMGKALKILRLKLVDFLPSLLFVLLVC